MLTIIGLGLLATFGAGVASFSKSTSLVGRARDTALSWVGITIRDAERVSGRARLERAIQSKNGKIREGIDNLAEHAATVATLERRHKDLGLKRRELEARVDFLQGTGHTHEDSLLVRAAEELMEVSGQHDYVGSQLSSHRALHEQVIAKLREAGEEIRRAEFEQEQLEGDLAAAKAGAIVGEALDDFRGYGGKGEVTAAQEDIRREMAKLHGKSNVQALVYGKDAADLAVEDAMKADKVRKLLESRRTALPAPEAALPAKAEEVSPALYQG